MKWNTPTGIKTLSEREVTDLAIAAARYDVLNGLGFNNSPVLDPREVFKR